MNRKRTRFSLRQTLRKTVKFVTNPILGEAFVADPKKLLITSTNSSNVDFLSRNETEISGFEETTNEVESGADSRVSVWRFRKKGKGTRPTIKGIMDKIRERHGPIFPPVPRPSPIIDTSHSEYFRLKLECLKPSKDFNSIPGGKKCCMKSAKCFQDLPDDLDEFDNQQNSEDFDAANVCREIDDALLCMSNVFINFDCHETADIVNRNLKTELQTVRKIYSGHCTGIPKQTTTVAGTDNLGNQNQSAAVSNDNLPTSALIGVAVGGLLFVAIFILVLVWLRSRRKPRDTESNKVVFENCSDDSSRYKSFTRRNSDVYAEIDDHALARSINLNNNKDVTQTGDEDTGLRPLPNAPSTQLTADDHGYLTPESTRRERAEESGYDQLARDMRNSRCLSQTYDKLESENGEMIAKSESRNSPEEDGDGEYITPPGKDPSPKQTSQTEENYHMYFVLEKQAGSSPT